MVFPETTVIVRDIERLLAEIERREEPTGEPAPQPAPPVSGLGELERWSDQVARGRPRDPQRGKSHSTGHRPQTGSGPPAVVGPAPLAELAYREPPADMPAVAAEVWRTIVADMAALRTLREVDLPLVRAYRQAAQIHADASDLITRRVCSSLGLPDR